MLAFGGVVGDRVPRRVVMVGSDVASAVVRTAMGALLISGHAEVWHLIALQACGGAAVAFYSPASYGLTREVVPENELQQANGLLAIARYAAFPLGGAIGGSIVVLVGTGAALLVDAGTYATSALLLSRIDVVSIARAGAGFLRELREGWSAFVEQTWVWVLVLWISFYFLITYAPFFVLGPYIAQHSMNGARSWTPVIVGEGVGALCGGLAGLRWRPRRPMVTAGFLLMVTAVQNLILAFHPETLLLTIAAAGSGFAFALGSVIWDTTLQRSIPPEKLARVASYGWMGAMVFLPAGYALAGPVSMVIGIKTTLVLAACWVVVSTLFVVRLRAVREVGLDVETDAVPVAAQ
jgi:MFS family permease